MKLFTKTIAATAILLFFTVNVFAQRGYFTTMSPGNLTTIEPKAKMLKKLIYLQLDEQSLRSYLLKAPMEFKNQGRPLPLEIPLPNGKFENFNMVESPVLSDKQAALHPEIKTYTGKGSSDKNATLRLSLTSSGFNAIILIGNGDAVYFEKSKGAQGVYFSYFAKDVTDIKINGKKLPGGSGGSDFIDLNKHKLTNTLRPAGANAALSTGSTLTLFRIAMSADGEFVAQHGGTQASAFNDAVGYVNRLNIVYRNELSVGFTLVSGQDLMFLDAATDPYDNDDESQIITTNTHTIDSAIGSANYDLANVLGYYPNTTGGGLAYIGSLGDVNGKGGATTAEGGTDVVAQALNDKTFFHETGHQFGMTHSFNSTIPVCVSREPGTSVEPGAGITIMSYSQICDGGDYIGDDYFVPEYPESRALLQFHTVNYQQAVAYLQTIQPYPSGVVVTNTGNNAPVITMPATYTIPKSTPFALTGIATDETPAALTYCWEGTNTGGDDAHPPDANTLADPAQSPFSRTYAPASTGTRTFPVIDSILNGSNKARADKLPSVSVPLTYNLTVRDNNPGAGAVSFGSVTVTVNGNIGPFLETKNLSGTYAGLSTQTITWSVNGTNAATPNIKISLSTDGGFTFPTVLLASTPNDGTQQVTLPNITTTTARIKVEGVGNIFFDISNVNFSINATVATYTITATAGTNGSISPSGAVSVASGTNKTFTITPNAGFTVAGVLVDGASVGAVTTYTFNNVIANHTISASFTAAGCTPPATPSNIIGQPYNLCGGGTFVFFVFPPKGAITYTWSVPAGFTITSGQGTFLVQVKVPSSFTTQGIISVKASNSCGTSAAKSLTVYATAGDLSAYIYGPSKVSPNQKNVQYSLPYSPGATYTWVAPSGANITAGQGTSTVTIKFGSASGYVKVTLKNRCGSSPQGSKYVTVGASAITQATLPAQSGTVAYLKAFPNPLQSHATMLFSSQKNNTKYQIIVNDITGKTLFAKTGMTVAGKNILDINMDKYSSGMYFVTLVSEDNSQTIKIVKEK